MPEVRFVVLVLALVAASLASGCGKRTNGADRRETSAALPAGWPPNLPPYPDSMITSASAGSGGMSITFQATAPPPKVIDFYRERLHGLKKRSGADLGPEPTTYEDGPRVIGVSIFGGGSQGYETVVTISVSGS